MCNTVKERTIKFVNQLGIKMKDFEKRCNLSTGYVTSMRKGFGSEKLKNVLNEFPQLNRDWLLYGEGSMFNNKEVEIVPLNSERKGNPVYNIDATCGAEIRDIYFTEESIIGYIDLPEIRSGACIVRANGDSMSPRIEDGNWVAIREIFNFNEIFYGQIYLVLTEEYRMLKYLRRCNQDEDNFVILHSDNPNYDDMKMNKQSIRKLFLVENILSIKIQL
jgi:phage repressor protein C with HTH and peptisase S24 domain